MNIYAQEGKVVIDAHGQRWLSPKEAFKLAADLMEKAKLAKRQADDAAKVGKDKSPG